MTYRRIILLLLLCFLGSTSLLQAEYYALCVDSAKPSAPIFFKSEIFTLREGTVLPESYHFVFERANKEDATWLLVTPAPRADSVGEFIGSQLKFAWMPLSEGLKLHVYVRCIPMQEIQNLSTTFLSGMNVAFASTDSMIKDFANVDEIQAHRIRLLHNPKYDTERTQQLFKKNVAERVGRASGSVTVRAFISESGQVQLVELKESNNPKLNVSAMRTVICTVFTVNSSSDSTQPPVVELVLTL